MSFPTVSKAQMLRALTLRKGRLSAARLAKRIEAGLKKKGTR
jgi:hypothetical protein